jgi:hypothetical protein
MRTTIRIDDDLLLELKERAHSEKLSLNNFLNRVLRRGLSGASSQTRRTVRFRERPQRMGEPLFKLDKALALAGALEDEQTVAKLAARK